MRETKIHITNRTIIFMVDFSPERIKVRHNGMTSRMYLKEKTLKLEFGNQRKHPSEI